MSIQESQQPVASRRSLLVVFNPRSGLSRVTRLFLEQALAETGAPFRVVVLDGRHEPRELIESSDPDASDVVVAAGGDGTVCGVAAAIAGTGRLFGVLPLGTRNHFAQDAGVPLDLAEAIASLQHGSPRPVDVAEVEGRVFINNANLGLYPRFVQQRRRRLERTARWMAIVGSAWWVLRRRHHLDVRIAGEAEDTRASVVFIGNNRYELEGLDLGRRRRLDEGVLTLARATVTGPVSAARVVARALGGRLEEDRDYASRTVREVRIDVRRRRVRVALDGETFRLRPPLHFRVRPGALRLLVPGHGGEGNSS